MEEITIVNEKDEIIGYKKRGSLDSEDIYRVSALWLTNSKGEVLLAQRAFTKSHDPGKWGPAVAGTIDKGETYKSNIIKETEEEIGIKNILPIKYKKVRVKRKYNYFVQWFTLKLDKEISEFKKQDEEVEKLKWFSKSIINNNTGGQTPPNEAINACENKNNGNTCSFSVGNKTISGTCQNVQSIFACIPQ